MELHYEVRSRYGQAQSFDDACDAARAVCGNESYIEALEVDVDEYINESYDSVEMFGHTFYPAEIIRELDYDEYTSCEQSLKESEAESNIDWVEELIESLDDGEEKRFEGGITVRCLAVFDDEDTESESMIDEDFTKIYE